MLKLEYTSFQYMIVYIAVLQGGLGAGQWLSYGPSKSCADLISGLVADLKQILPRHQLQQVGYWR
jgi:ATP-binding cassette, subfamily B (MDR/TAP), member 1